MRAAVLLLAASLPIAAQAQQLMTHHDSAGNLVMVMVRNEDCPNNAGRGCAHNHQGFSVVYIGGNERRLPHELAHVAGMQHTQWRKSSFGTECSSVTEMGHNTIYRVRDVICAGFDGSDIIYNK